MDTATTNPIQELGKWLVLFSKIKCHLLQYSVLDSTVRKKKICALNTQLRFCVADLTSATKVCANDKSDAPR